VARVVALVPDLMFGSKVVSILEAAGHEVTLTADPGRATDAEVVVVDLAGGVSDEALALGAHEGFTLAVYSHVEDDVRRRAEAAGFDRVVPRSRFVREGAALL
jgi:hypothetical protein